MAYTWEMSSVHKQVIQKNFKYLVDNMCMESLYDGLVAGQIFTSSVLENITVERRPSEKNRIALRALPARGPDAYDKFLRALEEGGQSFIREKLRQSECEIQGIDVPLQSPIQESRMPDQPMDEDANNETVVLMLPGPETPFSVQESTPFQPSAQDPAVGSSTSEPDPTCPPSQPSSAYLCARQEANDCYCMESHPRGRVLLINIKEFEEGRHSPRLASDEDVTNLRNMFEALSFTVQGGTVTDTAQEICERVAQFVNDEEQYCADCCIVALMSHGGEAENIYGWDGNTVSVKEIKDIFMEASVATLREKPKMLVLQACRGNSYDRGLNATDAAGDAQPTRGQGHSAQPSTSSRVPLPSDIVVAYPTFADNVAYRNVMYGSWFIQDLCSVFMAYSSKEHVVDMLVRVNAKVSQRFDVDTQGVQIPVPSVTLRKKWFLNPPTS